MSRVDLRGRCRLHGFPRVSGDEPARVAELNGGNQFSPRERG